MTKDRFKGQISVLSLKNQSLIADKCSVADRFFSRFRGLIGKARLAPGEGMLLSPCNDIHMWFMSFPIDVVFIRRLKAAHGGVTWKVSSAHENVRPWKIFPLRDGKATDTLELPAGTIQRCMIGEGDELCLS